MDNTKNYPKIIYKYRNWTEKYHKDVLRKNELYMPSPKEFNDPFDCRIPNNFTSLNSLDHKQEYANYLVAKHQEALNKGGYTYEAALNKIMSDLEDIKRYQEDHEQILFKQQDEDYAILSMSGRWNSILMWSHYANNHKGYCIGFYESKMRESRIFGWGGPLGYNRNNQYPIITPYDNGMDKLFTISHTKSNEWKYEKEYRLSDLLITDNLEIRKSRIRKIPNDFIAEINLGLMISEKDKSDILKWATKKKIKVYQLIKFLLNSN